MIDREMAIKWLEETETALIQAVDHGGSMSLMQAFKCETRVRAAIAMLKAQPDIVRCKDCKHGSVYMTEDVCGETLIECNRPCLGDVIEIHRWKWFCADGERR